MIAESIRASSCTSLTENLANLLETPDRNLFLGIQWKKGIQICLTRRKVIVLGRQQHWKQSDPYYIIWSQNVCCHKNIVNYNYNYKVI
jgi:hypothetical protein